MFGIAISCIPDTSKEMTEKTGLLTPSRFMVIFVAVVGLSSYAMLIETCGNKEQCNLAHPYVTWIPVSIKLTCIFFCIHQKNRYLNKNLNESEVRWVHIFIKCIRN